MAFGVRRQRHVCYWKRQSVNMAAGTDRPAAAARGVQWCPRPRPTPTGAPPCGAGGTSTTRASAESACPPPPPSPPRPRPASTVLVNLNWQGRIVTMHFRIQKQNRILMMISIYWVRTPMAARTTTSPFERRGPRATAPRCPRSSPTYLTTIPRRPSSPSSAAPASAPRCWPRGRTGGDGDVRTIRA